MSESDTVTISVEPSAALTIINKTDWSDGDMEFLRALSKAVETGKTLEWEQTRE